MEPKDDFTDKYFNTDDIKTQIDLINQPTAGDAMAEGFLKQGSHPALGKAQSASNALMTGFGSGMKAAENRKRQEQLSPILKQIGELNARTAYLKAQRQDQRIKALKVEELFKQNSFNLMNFSKANLVKDTNALNEISPALLRSYKQLFSDKSIGAYSHTHDGTIFYENNDTGRIDSVNVAQIIAQSGIDPKKIWGDDADTVMAGLSAGAREKFKNTQELQRQQLEKGRADIDNTKAQTGLYEAKTGKAIHEVNKQPDVITPEEAVTQETINLQKDAIKEIYNSRTADNFYKSAMKTAEGVLETAKKNPNKYERNLFSRAFDKEGDNIRLNESQERLHTVGTEIKGAMFKRFGYRNETEFENLPDISPNKTVQQNIAALEIIQDTYKRMEEEEENAINSFNKLIKSQHTPKSSANLATDQNTSNAPEFVQDTNGTIYRIKD